MATTIKMPQLGESVTEGTIERWLVKEGDTVEQYDPLFEVVTDKVNAEVPAEIAGTVTKILVPDGETVAVGTPVAEIDADGAGAGGRPGSRGTGRGGPGRETPAAEAPGRARAGSRRRLSRAGSAGARAGGSCGGCRRGRRRGAGVGPAGQRRSGPAAAARSRGAAAGRRDAPDARPPSTAGTGGGNGAARMTPAVRRLVREHDIDVAQLTRHRRRRPRHARRRPRLHRQGSAAGRGRGARAAGRRPQRRRQQPQPRTRAAPRRPHRRPPSRGGRACARRRHRSRLRPAATPRCRCRRCARPSPRKMTQVKQTVPHAYTVVEVDMTSVVRWREANNMAFKAREGASLSYVAVVVKAVTETLRKHPNLNSQFAEDKIILKQAMNIGIAVAVDNGLIVPVIANADQLSISGVNARVRDVSSRANGGKLQARRAPGRHVHGEQHRLVRIGRLDADHQRAGGGDPVDGGDRQAAAGDGGRRRGRHRHPPHDEHDLLVRSPRARRRAGRLLPGRCAQGASRSGTPTRRSAERRPTH